MTGKRVRELNQLWKEQLKTNEANKQSDHFPQRSLSHKSTFFQSIQTGIFNIRLLTRQYSSFSSFFFFFPTKLFVI